MFYLISVTGCHLTTKVQKTWYFTDLADGFKTRPSDTPANVQFKARLNNPGQYKVSLFGPNGRTNGIAQVDRGEIAIANIDGVFDEMITDYAFDGYPFTIDSVESIDTPYNDRQRITQGVVEQLQSSHQEITVEIASRLKLLEEPINPNTFKGTTTDGTKIEVEGDANLKDAYEPFIVGKPFNVSPLLVNRFQTIYQVGQSFDSIESVRMRGRVVPSNGMDYATVAALIAATVAAGYYATCKAFGLIKIGGGAVDGQVTVTPVRGSSLKAGDQVRTILIERFGYANNAGFFQSDIDALNAIATGSVGYWNGAQEQSALTVISGILDSVGAYITDDQLGNFRIGRFEAPTNSSVRTYTETEIVERQEIGIKKIPTGDDGKGIPAKSIIVKHSLNYSTTTVEALATSIQEGDKEYVTRAITEWLQEKVDAPLIEEVHKKATDLTFQSMLINKADALTEANRKKTLYSTQRDRYEIPVWSAEATGVKLGDTIRVVYKRYGLKNGRNFVVVGLDYDNESKITTLDVWG